MLDQLSSGIRFALKVAGFVLATVVLAFLIWWTVLRPYQQTVVRGNENVNAPVNGALPNVNQAGPRNVNTNAPRNANAALPSIPTVANGGETLETTIVSERVYGLNSAASGPQFYNSSDQRFYRLDADGNPVLLSDQTFFEATNVVFSPDGDRAIISYPDEANILYNFNTEQQITLPKAMNEFSFSPDGQEIAFQWDSDDPAEGNWIGVANPDGTGVQFIEPLGDKGNDVQIGIAGHREVIATFREGVDADQQEVFFIGKNNENFPSLKTDGRNFEGAYSKDGRKMLYSVYTPENDYSPRLHIVNSQGNAIGSQNVDLGLNTWSSKCAFGSGTTVYCAVPTGLERGSGIDPRLASDNPDDLYRIDYATGAKTRIAAPVDDQGRRSTSIERLVVSPDESRLYYVDSKTGELRSTALK